MSAEPPKVAALSASQARVCLATGFLVFSTVIVIVATLPMRGQSLFRDHLNDASHVVAFAVVTALAFFVATRLGLTGILRCSMAILLSGGLGLTIEVLQHFVPTRTASYQDLIRDAIGIAVGLCIAFAVLRSGGKHKKWRRAALLILASGLFLMGTQSLFDVMGYYRARNRHAPVLVGGADPWWEPFAVAGDLDFWSSLPPHDWPNPSDEKVLNLRFYPAEFSFFGMRDTYPDWSTARTVRFNVLSRAAHPFDLHFRIHDAQHNDKYSDRYNEVFSIQPGFQTIEIPIAKIQAAPQTRQLDLKRVSGLFLFSHRLPSRRHVIIDQVRLE